MRIVFFTTIDKKSTDGASIYLSRILSQLLKMGMEITVFALNMTEKDVVPANEYNIKGVKFIFFEREDGLLKEYFRLIFASINYIKKVDFTAHRVFLFQPVALVSKLANKKSRTIWFHDGIVEEIGFVKNDRKHRFFEKLAGLIEKFFSGFADWYLPVSCKMLDYSVEKGYKTGKDSAILPCVFDKELFVPKNEKDELKDIVIGYAGTMAPWQGFEEGCRYLSFLRDKGYNIKLSVLTFEAKRAISICEKYSLPYEVKSTDHKDVPYEMGLWDFALCFKFPGVVTKVSSPLKVGEAMAMGKPLIISKDIGDYSSLVSHNKFGVVVDMIDEKEWIRSVEEFDYILKNYNRIRKDIREYAVNNLSTDYLERILKKVVAS